MTKKASWKEQIRPKARVVQRLAATEEGQALFDLLERTFQSGTLLAATPEKTAYAVGQFELVAYLKELRDLREDDDE